MTAEFCADLRKIQQRSKCTEALCADVVLTLGKYLNVTPRNFRKYDKQMQQAAGINFLRLNGCIGCKNYVYLPSDPRRVCPRVKEDGNVCGSPRFDDQGKAVEVCFVKMFYSEWELFVVTLKLFLC